MPTTGENIKALREQRKLSQTQLAEMIGVRPSAVSMWEKGPKDKSGRLPENRSLWKIAEALGVTIDEVAGDDAIANSSTKSSSFTDAREVEEYLATTLSSALKRDFAPGTGKLLFIGLLQGAVTNLNGKKQMVDILAYFRDPLSGDDYQVAMEVKKMAPASRRQ
jgi:transcriptional regulator with XRE-family HTH domain